MSSDRQRPVASLTFKKGDQGYSILSIWKGRFPGTYSISKDKGSDRFPSIGTFRDFLGACASCWSGDGFLNLSIESGREQRGSGGQRNYGGDSSYDRPRGTGAGPTGGTGAYGASDLGGDDFGGGGGEFGGDEIPFGPASKGIAQ
jgi:hypothetical protein